MSIRVALNQNLVIPKAMETGATFVGDGLKCCITKMPAT